MLEHQTESISAAVATAPADDLYDLIAGALAELRPHLKRDGGDIELVAVDGDMVVVDMKGSCSGCVLASVTVAGVRKRLIEKIGRPLRVVPLAALANLPVSIDRKAVQ